MDSLRIRNLLIVQWADGKPLRFDKSLIVGHIADQIELLLSRLTTSRFVKYS
jgi:hypothetical protein